MFNYWLQGGRVDVGFLGAAQVDRFGNINTTEVGRGAGRPAARLPGAGGAPEIAANCREVLMVLRHSARAFVPALDFVTTLGHGYGPLDRARLGLPGAGPVAVITDLGVLRPDPHDAELVLTEVHPGVTVERVRAATGWPLRVAAGVTTTAPPTARELAALRALKTAATTAGRNVRQTAGKTAATTARQRAGKSAGATGATAEGDPR
jgi:acyl CoA:acetate/3-ketoacid CoA transferase beta subunit